MLNAEQLAIALDTRDRTYRLLLWISDIIEKEKIPVARVAHHTSGQAATTEWLTANYYNIPETLRPGKTELAQFATFFCTFLTSSFDLIEKPGTKGEGPASPTGCNCEICLLIVNAPHLRTKKLTARDKFRANCLMTDCVIELANEHRLSISDDRATQIVTDPKTRRAAGYLAYGFWLIKRLAGESDGPAVLALWRIVAWDTRGGQSPGFELKLDDFFQSEKTLLAAIGIAV